MISTRTTAANESQAGPQPRGAADYRAKKLMSWQRDQNRLRTCSTALAREVTETALGVGQSRERNFHSSRIFAVANSRDSCVGKSRVSCLFGGSWRHG